MNKQSGFRLSKRSMLNREGVDCRLIEISDLAIQITIIDFGHPKDAGKRSPERQLELFNAGKSKCDGLKRVSKHQYGHALDFYAYVDGRASWEKEHLAIVAAAFLQAAAALGHKLEWGGLFRNFCDMPHVQIAAMPREA